MLADLKSAALELAAAGFAVFPIKAGDKRPPLVKRGFYAASTEAAVIGRWWSLFPDANIGLRTGDGLAVVDVDPRNGGEIPLWLPGTAQASTPSGGYHFYYRVDSPVRCSSGRLAPGVDVKADGGYVLAPPSRRLDGAYFWMCGHLTALAEIDPRSLNAAAPTPIGVGQQERPTNWTPWEPREIVREGERHDELTSWAGHLRSQGHEYEEILEVLEEVNETFQPPLDDHRELTGIARWAARRPL